MNAAATMTSKTKLVLLSAITLLAVVVIPAIAGCIAALIAPASPARADDQSFLNYPQAHGQSTTAWPMSPAQFVILGHGICTNLRAGADPLAGTSPIERVTWGPVAVEAAQHELCPDTLH
jgi:hypothetical protein